MEEKPDLLELESLLATERKSNQDESLGRTGQEIDNEECLICGEKITEHVESLSLPGAEGSYQLNRDMWNTFVLRKLLKYPDDKIKELMQVSEGVLVGNWFELCVVCRHNLEAAMKIYWMLLDLTRDLEKYENLFKETIKREVRRKSGRKDVAFGGINFVNRIRSHFRKGESGNTFTAAATGMEFEGEELEMNVTFSDDQEESLDPLYLPNEGDENQGNMPLTSGREKMKFQCLECPASFNTETSCKHHTAKHTRVGVLPCQICNFPAANAKILKKHKTMEHFGGTLDKCKINAKGHRLRCKICTNSKVYTNQHSFKRHKKAHQDFQFSCPKCKFPCATKKQMILHLEKRCGWRKRIKLKATEILTPKVEVEANPEENDNGTHEIEPDDTEPVAEMVPLSQDSSKPFSCSSCPSVVSSIQGWYRHRSLHNRPGILPCDICNYPAANLVILKKHKSLKHSKEPSKNLKSKTKGHKLQCKLCEKIYTNTDSFQRHMKAHQTSKHSCKKCMYPCATPEALILHTKRNYCRSRSKSQKVLGEPTRKKETEKQKFWKCEKCPLKTSSKTLLRKHREKVNKILK